MAVTLLGAEGRVCVHKESQQDIPTAYPAQSAATASVLLHSILPAVLMKPSLTEMGRGTKPEEKKAGTECIERTV